MELQLRGLNRAKSYPFFPNNHPHMAELHTDSNVIVYNYCMLNENHPRAEEMHKYLFKNNKIVGLNKNNEVKKLRGAYLFCGYPFWNNYGHFTLNIAGVFLLAKKLQLLHPSLRIIIPDRTAFHHEILSLYGISEYECIDLPDDIFFQVEKILYCDVYHGNYFHPDYVELFEKIANEIHPQAPADIYITRNANSWRVPDNEADVIDYFTKKNFKVFDFGAMPVKDQIAAIMRANNICAGHGASGANLVYHNEQCFKFIEYFIDRCISPYNTNLLFSKNVDYCGYVLDAHTRHHATCNLDKYNFNFELYERESANPVFHFRRNMLQERETPSGLDIYERYITPYMK